MKKFYFILSISLIGLIAAVVLFKTILLGGKHLLPYFSFVILFLEVVLFLLFQKRNRKRIIQSGIIYLAGYIMIMFLLFKVYHWPNHDYEIVPIPKEYTSYNWQTDTPHLEDFDTIELSKILEKANSISQIRSVLIVKDNKLVVEKYFHGCSENDAFNIFLMSQSFISSLIGLAIQEDYIDDVSQKMMDFFPKYKSKAYILDKTDLTIEHLLTNTAGLSGNLYERSFRSLNWTKSIFERPRVNKSGEFKLQQQNYHLLSGIISHKSGLNTLDFAEQNLCTPLGIKIIDWFQSPEGIYRGSNAIYITPRDLAKYGNLYLTGGSSEGKQIIPQKWIEESIKIKVKHEVNLSDNFRITGVGYAWLSGIIHHYDVIFTTDLRGQFIINIPKKNVTIVTTTYKLYDYKLMETLVCDLISTII